MDTSAPKRWMKRWPDINPEKSQLSLGFDKDLALNMPSIYLREL